MGHVGARRRRVVVRARGAGSVHDGGDKTYETYEELEAEYISGAVHPGDLKPSLSAMLNEILQPVRDHFKNNTEAKNLLAQIKKYKVTK